MDRHESTALQVALRRIATRVKQGGHNVRVGLSDGRWGVLPQAERISRGTVKRLGGGVAPVGGGPDGPCPAYLRPPAQELLLATPAD